ncbi:transcription elongation factor SPT6-like [Actinia tenebrosa]|uniref:Transcription elongation factor SPT6-like n=1 Tax=Actinia tenebrosa TaxID=6105 RepID=A0A6P8HU64_ACTTE|nr:transcription elongation factor SPT6-like [Actinia tenebrosa]
MSDLVESEAEESLDELLSSASEEEEEENENRNDGDLKDLINDEEEESAASDEEISESGKSNDNEEEDDDDSDKRHGRKRGNRDAELDEEDLDLIQENLGIRLPKKKFHRLKKVKVLDSSDEDDEGEGVESVQERETIANELFKGGDDEREISRDFTEPVVPAVDSTYADIDESESEEDEFDNFIVDDDGKPIKHHHPKIKRVMIDGEHDSALQEAQDTFGLDFDFDEFEKFGQEDYDDEEDYEDEEEEARIGLRKAKRKAAKKSIFEVFEPSELEKGMLTSRDTEIKTSDIPERFQLRDVPVKPAEDSELEEEAEWIYKYAFLEQTISQQNVDEKGIQTGEAKATKPHSAIGKIQEALNLMRNQLFEVPFIANYRKEYVEPELNVDDLWKIWEWDEKWIQLRTRKDNLHRLFEQIQEYQFGKVRENSELPLEEDTRILQPEDIDRLDAVQTIDQLKDVYSHFMLYYGNDIPAMQEANRRKAKEEKEARQEGEEEDKEEQTKTEEPPKLKKPRKRDLYTICIEAGLGGLARKFGLTPDQFGENLRDNYQRHETEQHPMDPGVAAESYLTSTFSTTDQVMEGARHVVAMQIAKDPLVRQCVRETFYERAKLTVSPTKKGKKEIDESHPCFSIKYLKNKPVRDLRGDQFLRLSLAEQDRLLTISISIDFDNRQGYQTYFDEVKQLYHRDEFSLLVQEWNAQRYQALMRAFNQMLYPVLEKELKAKLLQEAKDFVIKCCQKRLRSWIEVAPFQPEQQHEDQDYDDQMSGDGLRVLACSFLPDPSVPAFFAMLDGSGQVSDYLRLKYLLTRRNTSNTREKEMKEKDMETLKEFILKKKPDVIAVGAISREAISVVEDIKMCLAELEQENQMAPIGVELVDTEVARIYQASPRSDNEVREYPPVLRNAISIGRRMQDPLAEFASLCVEEDEMLCIKYHPFQDQVDKEHLIKALHEELVTLVNDVGVDPNRILNHQHTVALLQFVCGLGPRKASTLIKGLRQQGSKLENRSQLVTVCNLGPKIFLNCAGFIKIDTTAISDTSTDYVEVLDGSRVHPETYEWAKQMAVDALEYDDTNEEANPSAALEEILETPDRLKDLDLDAFAEELERQNYGNKKITLYDIRDELFGRYRDRRVPFRSLSIEEVFKLLTGETPETLYVGKLVVCTVTGFAFRKPHRDMIDQANPERNDETGLWQCPFCLNNDYPELSEVWTHLDNGSCPGQAVGVRTRLENGLSGFIPTKMISDKHIKSPQERVKVGMTLHCRVTRINMERFQLDLTCRTSDLSDKDSKFSLPKDLYYDKESEDKDKREEEMAKKKANRPKYIKRVIVHPSFRNISFKEAEKVLADMEQGECIVRPSSKGSDHLTVTWKVEQGIYQHIDVREEGKENAFSLGRSLWIENEEFEDLDEIIARHIQPMASLAREVVTHKYHRPADGGSKPKLEELLVVEKKKAPQRIPYFISLSKAYPGKFLLGYLPRVKPRTEMVSITPDGFKYRNRVHSSINGLFRWFKEHFRDPIPGVSPRSRTTPSAMSESNTPYTPGATPLTSDMDANQLVLQLQQHFPRGITAANQKVYSGSPAVPRTEPAKQTQPPTFAQWGATSSSSSAHPPAGSSGAQANITPQAYSSSTPQFGYYQTHQDSITTAVQNYAYQQQQKQNYRS